MITTAWVHNVSSVLVMTFNVMALETQVDKNRDRRSRFLSWLSTKEALHVMIKSTYITEDNNETSKIKWKSHIVARHEQNHS